jgi:hypothetical protein
MVLKDLRQRKLKLEKFFFIMLARNEENILCLISTRYLK